MEHNAPHRSAIESTQTTIIDRVRPEERFALLYTLKCNIECAHCLVSSSPRRKEKMSVEDAQKIIKNAWERGKRLLTFSGGEVSLYENDLLQLIPYAKDLGFLVDMESNAFWARTYELAVEKLSKLKNLGLDGVCFSFDYYHKIFFPTERVVHAYRAAKSLNLLVEINFCPSPFPEQDQVLIDTLHQEQIPFLWNSTFPLGFAKSNQTFADYSLNDFPDCDNIHMTVLPNGDHFACCMIEDENPELKESLVYLGNISDQEVFGAGQLREKIVQAFYDPNTPLYFRALVKNNPLFQSLNERKYSSICGFCKMALSSPERVKELERLYLEFQNNTSYADGIT